MMEFQYVNLVAEDFCAADLIIKVKEPVQEELNF